MIKEWLKRIREYPALVDELAQTHANLQEQVEENLILKDALIQKVTKKADVTDAEYWNNRWKQSKVYYACPKRIQVTSMITINKKVTDFADLFPIAPPSADEVPFLAMSWLDNNFKEGKFKYVADKGEKWQLPEETLSTGKGDCDDWGIVLYCAIRDFMKKFNWWEANKHRLKCVAGNVNRYAEVPYVEGGHFYLLWLHSDGEWRTVETTYFRERAILDWGKPHKLKPQYGVIWFTFTEYASWAQNSITVTKEDFK